MILVTGSAGQLGFELKKLLGDKGIFLDRTQADFSNPEELRKSLKNYKFDYLINAAAYTQVDKAETEQELAMTVNATSVGVLAEVCLEMKARFAHVSSDYVFPGTAINPYVEDSPTDPVNFYGKSKLEGERLVREILPESLIIRTSWVWSQFGNNFVNTIIKLANERQTIGIVSDQIGSPTFVGDLAGILLKSRELSGIRHFSNTGEASWFEFACAIKKTLRLKVEIVPINTADYLTLAKRPAYSVLQQSKEFESMDENVCWIERLRKIS